MRVNRFARVPAVAVPGSRPAFRYNPSLPASTMRTEALSDFWRWWGAVAAAYCVIVFVLCPGNQLVGFPVHHDDFTTLGADPGLFWRWPRPVFFALSVGLGAGGVTVLYASLHLFVIVYAALSLLLLAKLLDVPRVPLLFAIPLAAGALSLENMIEYSKYAGMLTNLSSGNFAVAAMCLMMFARGEDGRPRWWRLPAVWVLAGVSFFSKEDFAVATALLALYLAWKDIRLAHPRASWGVAMVAGILLLGAAVVAYNHAFGSVYTQSAKGPYKSSFNPVSMCRTAAFYFLSTRVTILAGCLQVLTLIGNFVAGSPVRWPRLLLYHALVAALILPYTCLPRHTAGYYALNWVVWQIGGALLLLWKMGDRRLWRAAFVVVPLACLYLSQPARRGIVDWYLRAAEVNRNIMNTLGAHAEQLRPYRQVVVEGAPPSGPWFGNAGRYLARCGLDHQWIVRAPKESEYYRQVVKFLGRFEFGSIRTVAAEEEPMPAAPLVRLNADGTGAVEFPGASPKDPGTAQPKGGRR